MLLVLLHLPQAAFHMGVSRPQADPVGNKPDPAEAPKREATLFSPGTGGWAPPLESGTLNMVRPRPISTGLAKSFQLGT